VCARLGTAGTRRDDHHDDHVKGGQSHGLSGFYKLRCITLQKPRRFFRRQARRSTTSDVRRERSDSRLSDGVGASTEVRGPAFGILMTNVVPTPKVDSTSMSPLWS
jgi:hypothetical protein